MRRCVLFCLLFALLARAEDDQPVPRHKRALTDAVVFTAADKDVAVNAHNEARQIVSPTASDMIEMVWDERLAQIAEAYSRRCLWEHNPNRNVHANFTSVGENLYLASNAQSVSKVMEAAVKSWDSEKADFTFSTNRCSRVCGHYTQVVWASSYAVGCGVSTCSNVVVDSKTTWPTGQIVVCNYGPAGNFPTQPFTSGASCSACPKEFPHCNNNLCSKTGGADRKAPSLAVLLAVLACSLLPAFD